MARRVQRRFSLPVLLVLWSAAFLWEARAEGLARGRERFYYPTGSGVASARIIHRYFVPIVHPFAIVAPPLDSRLRTPDKGRLRQQLPQLLAVYGKFTS